MTKQHTCTAPELWDTYRRAVNGVSWQGSILPPFDGLGDTQQQGWQAVADLVNKDCPDA